MISTIPVLRHPTGDEDLRDEGLGDVYEVVVGGQAGRDMHRVLLDAAAPQAESLRRRVDAIVGHGPTCLTAGVLVWSVDSDTPSELALPPDPRPG